jgi:transcriptional regulator with XRE-family HTH domain
MSVTRSKPTRASSTRKRLHKWRVAHGLTQHQAAKRAGLHQSAWSQIEQGDRMPSIEQGLRLQLVTGGEIVVTDWVARSLARDCRPTGTEG